MLAINEEAPNPADFPPYIKALVQRAEQIFGGKPLWILASRALEAGFEKPSDYPFDLLLCFREVEESDDEIQCEGFVINTVTPLFSEAGRFGVTKDKLWRVW